MKHKIDLGKLIKLCEDAHAEFKVNLTKREWGSAKSFRESLLYRDLKTRHFNATEGAVSFNPIRMFRIRRRAQKYLRRYAPHKLSWPPNQSTA
jgi:hypothetical protein